MDCLKCNRKACKAEAKDCTGARESIVEMYKEYENMYLESDKLVAGGRAGELSRLEEIIEFSKASGYQEIALAYCFSMETLAEQVKFRIESSGLKTSSYRCTIQGIRETDISDQLKNSVNCNPIGQAMVINESKADLVVEMGLCLGHDMLFHKHLDKMLTVLFVKDRKWKHVPQRELE